MNGESEKSKGVAYLLLVVGPAFGLFGLHRFYMGQIGKGVLYLLTFGFIGIGQLIDLFTFAQVVENHNLRLELGRRSNSPYNDTPRSGHADSMISLSRQLENLKKLNRENRDRVLLRFIQTKGGMVHPLEIVAASNLNMEEAKRELDNFCIQGAAELRITEAGEMLYVFPGFLDDEQKKKARSVMSI